MAPDPDILNALEQLKQAVSQLPSSTPAGAYTGPVARNFGPGVTTGEISLWEWVDRAYTRCFARDPRSNPDPRENICGGPFGMDLVIAFFESVLHSPELKSTDGFLIKLKLNQLTELVLHRIKMLPGDPAPPRPPRTSTTNSRSKTSQKNKNRRRRAPRKKGQSEYDSASDSDYNPADDVSDEEPSSWDESGVHTESDDTNLDTTRAVATQPAPSSTTKAIHSHKRRANSDTEKPPPRKKQSRRRIVYSSADEGDGDDESDEIQEQEQGIKPGPKDDKKKWALTHYTKPEAGINPKTSNRVWVFRCKYCPAIRRIPRTYNIKNFAEDNVKFSASNFTRHLRECENMPQSEKYELALDRGRSELQPTGGATSLGSIFATSNSNSQSPAPGTARPVALTKSRFRSGLIQAVVQDTYPLTFGEGQGMISLFRLLNPTLQLPSHQTMRRDLDKLYSILSMRSLEVLKMQNSRMAIASDAWTSKSFVYSLSGVVVSFIDDSWTLHQFPIDVIHLDAEHSGVAMGRKIFDSLKRRGVAAKLVASVTDNASNNRVMNGEIARRFTKRFRRDLSVDNMTITCIAHVIHLILGALFSKLRVMQPMDDDEAYSVAKSFDPCEKYEDSQEVRDEQARLEKESGLRGGEDIPADGSDLDTDDEDGSSLEDTANRHSPEEPAAPSPNTQAELDGLNPLEKLHAIVVHATASPSRRKKMRQLILKLCTKPLVPIKSMPVRWGSVLAEIRRGILLKSAINQWVSTLDDGLTGKAWEKARALKRRWTITDPEWDLLALLAELLEPFEQATKSFSQNGVESSLPAVLPTYAILLDGLNATLKNLKVNPHYSRFGLEEAITEARNKLIKYVQIAKGSDLVPISLMCHPALRLTNFSDGETWGDISYRGTRTSNAFDVASTGAPAHGSWMDALVKRTAPEQRSALIEELRDYFSNKYPFEPGTNLLQWWKDHSRFFPVLSRIARDYLCIPATSVSVERLFSQCRLVMTDYRNMSVETARRLITCHQWLKAGLGTNLPDFIAGEQ